MNTKKIKDAEIADLTIASLPSRPTAPKSFGGRGFTASEMKAAFDRLPLFIIERLNRLIDDIGRLGEGSMADEVPTGISDGHTLGALFGDITSGRFANYLTVLGEPLCEIIMSLKELSESHPEDIEALRIAIGAATSKLDGAEGDIATLTTSLDGAKAKMEMLSDDLSVAMADILLLDTDVDGTKERLSTIEDRLLTLEDNDAEQAKTLADADAKIAELINTTAQAGEQITLLEDSADELLEAVNLASEKIDEDRARLTAIEADIAECENATSEAISDILEQGERLTVLEAKVEGLGGDSNIYYPDENEDEHSITLTTGLDARLGYTEAVYITLPSPTPEDFYALVSFYSNVNYKPSIVWDCSYTIYFSGDDIEDGEFYPDTSKHYTLFFWYDGNLHCNVRAVRHE